MKDTTPPLLRRDPSEDLPAREDRGCDEAAQLRPIGDIDQEAPATGILSNGFLNVPLVGGGENQKGSPEVFRTIDTMPVKDQPSSGQGGKPYRQGGAHHRDLRPAPKEHPDLPLCHPPPSHHHDLSALTVQENREVPHGVSAPLRRANSRCASSRYGVWG